jgi:ribosome-binding ATPase YchF (GTP1/OBG family)
VARYVKPARAGDKEAQRLVAVLEKAQAVLDQAKAVRTLDLAPEEWDAIRPFCLITAKPTMYVANVREDGFDNNPHLDAVREYAKQTDSPVVAVCAAIEAEIADLDDADKAEFLADLGMEEPGLDLLHRRRQGSARLDHPRRRHRPQGGRRDPHRLRTRLHPRADHRL